MKRAFEILAKNSAQEERMQTAPPETALPRMPMDVAPHPTDEDLSVGTSSGRGDVELC